MFFVNEFNGLKGYVICGVLKYAVIISKSPVI
jgi:hypothetical protein